MCGIGGVINLSKNGFYLPSGLGISNSEIDYVANTLLKILANKL